MADFGLAKENVADGDKLTEMCGTEEYVGKLWTTECGFD